MKKVISILMLIFICQFALAIDLEIEKETINNMMISDLNVPAIFNLEITNNGDSDDFRFYNLVGFELSPNELVRINSGETKNIEFKVFPRVGFDHNGMYILEYVIRASDVTEIERQISFKVIEFGEAFEIGAGEISPESNLLEIYIENKMNYDFNNLSVDFSSAFFNFQEVVSLSANEKKSFDVELKKEDFKKLMAGFYTLNAKVVSGDVEGNTEGTIKFTEKDIVETLQRDYGFIINTKVIKKTNEGNVVLSSQTVIGKNIFSRLFTTFNTEPELIERQGMKIYYTWIRNIKPGEDLEIIARTNWLFPFLIVFFIVVIIVFVKKSLRSDLVLKKRVSFVKTKGGEFALKVNLVVKAKNYVENVKITDRLPLLVKLYERFGSERPSSVNHKARQMTWNFEKLERGETRVLSYIIYSKVGILGRFVLPSAMAIYERDGKMHEMNSNRAFFVTESKV